MKSTFSRLTAIAPRAAAACAAALLLASCGGGGVSANPSPIVDSPTLTILPATAVVYSGLPTTFVFSGGTGAYIIASSNQAILPVIGGVTGRSVTIVPNPVTAETQVTLTLRDTGAAVPVTATVTVRPGTVNNDLTITPSSTQDASCSPAVCSGGDAEAKVTISQGGVPLAARGVRFQVVTGSYAFLESPPLSRFEVPGVPTSLITTTDETGTARATLRVTALAPNQTATVRVTDMGTGAYREASFAIAQFTGNTPAFFTLPSSITFTGPYDECAPPDRRPPRTSRCTAARRPTPSPAEPAPSPSAPTTVTANGGRFSIELFAVPPGGKPACFEGASVGVTDATGRTIAVTVNNTPGTGTAPAPAVALLPTTLIAGLRRELLDGDHGGHRAVQRQFEPSQGDGLHQHHRDPYRDRHSGCTRSSPRSAAYPTTATITVTDGTTSKTATVTVPATCRPEPRSRGIPSRGALGTLPRAPENSACKQLQVAL